MSDANPAKRSPGGRPSKFTPEVRSQLVELIARGVPYAHAARAVGITYQSFLNYREAHPDFKDELESAVAKAIEKRLAIIEKAADAGDVRAAAWLLEHLHPAHFAKSRVEISGPNGTPLAAAVMLYLPQKDGAMSPVTTEIKEIEDAE